jgi:hypothetical protein
MNVASSSRSTSGLVAVSRSANTCGQSISWAVVMRRFLCSSDFDGSLEESRDNLHSSGYDTPDLTGSYTTFGDATLANELTTGHHGTQQCSGMARRRRRLRGAQRPRIANSQSKAFGPWAVDMVGSMGRVGAAGDNAAMESFFSLLQKTSWTAAAGTRASSCTSPSSPGSNAPTTADAGKSVWAG